MKIVFFDFVMHFGGAVQLAADTAKRLACEHEVEIIDAYGVCEEFHKTLKDSGVKAHILVPEAQQTVVGYRHDKLKRIWRMLRQSPTWRQLRRRLIHKIRQINPDVIWTNGTNALAFLSSSLRLMRYPAVMCVCGCLEAGSIRGWRRYLMKHRCAVLMAVSTETAKQLLLAGMKKQRVQIVFDTIDFKDTVERSKKSLDLPLQGMTGFPRILLPATLIRAKGHDTAIESIAELKSRGLAPTLLIAGDATSDDHSYVEYLHRLVEKHGLSNNVYFLGWRTDVPAIMTKAQMVVLPTHSEGFGHVILEAMLLRRPVVATPVGGIKDLIRDGYNGFFFPVRDYKTLADKIEMIYRDSRLAEKLVENGYKTATERFSPGAHTRRITNALTCAVRSSKN